MLDGLLPMELRAADAIPDGPGWLYEPKWDGFRCLTHRDGDRIELVSKNGQPLARYFPEVVAAIAQIGADAFSLDGELVVPVGDALAFDALQARIHPAASRVAFLARTTPARYLVFDILRFDNGDQVNRPLRERRAELELFMSRVPAHSWLRLSPATRDRRIVDAWFARVGGAIDGVVAKRLDAFYLSGKREGGVKIKLLRTADCVIGGFRYAAGAHDRVGSLLLGLYDIDGRLDYIGFCSAFPTQERHGILGRLEPYFGGAGFSGSAPGGAPSRWTRDPERDRSYIALEPALVLEVAFDQVTSGRMRHGARPLCWRTDKSPRACTSDQLVSASSALALFEV
jgi:ATP-dependent DNA ligase